MRRVLLLLLASWLTALLATPASAHTSLLSSAPAAGSTTASPTEVVLSFSDAVQPGLSAVSVTGADGGEHAAGAPVAGADGSSVVQPLRAALGAGTYRVAYRVLAADGHPVTGSFEITTTAPSPGATPVPTVPAPATGATTGPLQPVAEQRRDDGGSPVLPLAAGGLLVAGAAGLLARRLAGPPPPR